MPGKWLKTVVSNRESISYTIDTTFTKNVDLPTSNFIGRVLVEMEGVGTGTVNGTISRIEVVANGSSSLYDLSGAHSRAISTYDYENAPPSTAGGTTDKDTFILEFQRFEGDVNVILPAKLFKTLQLKVTYSYTGTTVTAAYITVTCLEYVSNDDPYSKLIKKTIKLEDKATGTGWTNFDLPLGNLYKRLILYAGTTTTVDDIQVKVNNGAEIPVSDKWTHSQQDDYVLYKLDSTACTALANYTVIDFDNHAFNTLEHCLPSFAYNDLKLHVNRGTTTTTLTLITEEIVQLKK